MEDLNLPITIIPNSLGLVHMHSHHWYVQLWEEGYIKACADQEADYPSRLSVGLLLLPQEEDIGHSGCQQQPDMTPASLV